MINKDIQSILYNSLSLLILNMNIWFSFLERGQEFVDRAIGILSKQGHGIFKTLCPEFHWENATIKLPSIDQGLIGKKVGRIFTKIFYELSKGFCF
jgi:hypothetical protein